jgi:hypothetical protein
MGLAITQVDTFTDRLFTGNPAAPDCWLSHAPGSGIDENPLPAQLIAA